MAGTIATRVNELPDTSVSYDPERLKLDDNEDTVEGRISRIISKNSALNTAARTNADYQFAARGLSKSAMAVSAGESAVINNAIPIATTDANNSIQAKLANQQAGNTALQFGASNLAGIQSNRLNIAQQTDAQSRLAAEKADIDMRLQTADAALRERLMARQGEIDTELQNLRGSQSVEQIQAQGDVNRANTLAEVSARGDVESRLQQEQIAGRLAADQALAQTTFLNDRAMQELKGEQQFQLTEMDASYRLLAQTSNSVAGFYAQISDSISTILASNIPAAEKQGLVDQQMSLLQGGLRIIGGTANVDFLSLLGIPQGGAPSPTPNPGALPTPIGAPPALANSSIYQQVQEALRASGALTGTG